MSRPSRVDVNTLGCPRCDNQTVMRSDAPDGSQAWFICNCEKCYFSWRSTEDVTHVLETAEGGTCWLGASEIAKLPRS